MSRMVAIRCPWCGHRKLVSKKSLAPAAHRVCPACKKHFPDPLAKKAKRSTKR
jgi:DNA-directed RNA polymerase subunit RPC12/RpoP